MINNCFSEVLIDTVTSQITHSNGVQGEKAVSVQQTVQV